jgi:hypothetical protein
MAPESFQDVYLKLRLRSTRVQLTIPIAEVWHLLLRRKWRVRHSSKSLLEIRFNHGRVRPLAGMVNSCSGLSVHGHIGRAVRRIVVATRVV